MDARHGDGGAGFGTGAGEVGGDDVGESLRARRRCGIHSVLIYEVNNRVPPAITTGHQWTGALDSRLHYVYVMF